jgi:hypothetical protein
MTKRLLFIISLCSINSLFSQTVNDLLYETFGSGVNTTTPGISSAYCWNNQPFPPGQPCGNNIIPGILPSCGSYFLDDNQYVVTSALNPNNCSWFKFLDHTSSGTDLNGRFLAINIGSAAGPNSILYSQQINNIIPNREITAEVCFGNLLRVGSGGVNPAFILELVDENNRVVSNYSTGEIQKSNQWYKVKITLNPESNTSLKFNIRSSINLFAGNDAVIDDIKLSQLASLSTEESIFDKIAMYPIPVKNDLHIDNVVLEKATIYNALGKIVQEVTFASNINNTVNVQTLSKGVYFINLKADGVTTFKKIIIE